MGSARPAAQFSESTYRRRITQPTLVAATEVIVAGAITGLGSARSIPRQSLQATATLHTPFASLVTEATATDKMFVNDANSESAPGYGVVNARIVSSAMWGGSGAEVTVGAQNVFNTRYVSSVSVNAAGGKFYEPGLQRSIFIGITVMAAPGRSP